MEQNTDAHQAVEADEVQMEESINPSTPPILVESPAITDSFVQMMDGTNASKPVSEEPEVLNASDAPDNGSGELDTSTPPIMVESPPLTESLIQMIGDAEKANLESLDPAHHSEHQTDGNNTDSNGFEYVDSIKITSLDQSSSLPEGDVVKEETACTANIKVNDAVQEAGDQSSEGIVKKDESSVAPPAIENDTSSDKKNDKMCPWDCASSLGYVSVGVAILAGLTYFVMKHRAK